MKYIATIMVLFALVLTGYAGPAGESQTFYAADAAPAVWIKNTGSEKVVIGVTADSGEITVTIGSIENAIDASGTDVDTVVELETAIVACTNSAGKKPLEVFRCAPLGTETIDDELLIGTTTIYGGSSGGGVLWDTSDTKHYRVYIPPKDGGAKRGALAIKSVFGDVKGTGNVVIKAYLIDGSTATQVDMREFVSPAYVLGVTATTNVADEIAPGVIDIPLDIQTGANQGFLVDCVRATTGTTGGAGVLTEGR